MPNNRTTKHVCVLLDEEGDVVEVFSENAVVDQMFEIRRALCPSGRLYSATITLGSPITDSVHQPATERPIGAAKVQLAGCTLCYWCDRSHGSSKWASCEHPEMDGRAIPTKQADGMTPEWCPKEEEDTK